MRKLVTPIVFEESLKDLTPIQSLNVCDEHRLTVEHTLACVNPVGVSNPVIAKNLGSDNNGSLLSKKDVTLENYQTKGFYCDESIDYYVLTFNQYIKTLTVWHNRAYPWPYELWWVTMNDKKIMQFPEYTYTTINVYGKQFKFKTYSTGLWVCYASITGYY